jgi:hypothetical protein
MANRSALARPSLGDESELRCALQNGDCRGSLQSDHIGYNSVTQRELFQYLCAYHNCTEARELRFFVANQVLGGRPLSGPVRIRLNEWHIRYGLHPKLKIRIHEVSEKNPLPTKFVPGQGQKYADKQIAEGRCFRFRWKAELAKGKLIGFWIQFEGGTPTLVR